MNLELARNIADAVLYEGYILYPYRPSSVKNRQRWTFGGLYPHSYTLAQGETEPWTNQTECLVAGQADTRLDIKARFLQLQERTIGELAQPVPQLPENEELAYRPVASLRAGGKLYQSWQEATEREVLAQDLNLNELVGQPYQQDFTFPSGRELQPLSDTDGLIHGMAVRQRQALAGRLEVAATQPAPDLFKVTLRIFNQTPLEQAGDKSRDEAVLWAFISTHSLWSVRQGEFISLLEPLEQFEESVAACQNVGTWPVLVGEEGERDMLLSSPIILYDYPQIAPESAGDLFDGTEIDEILTLRILTMTDAEKEEMREVDERAGALLERSEALSGDQLMQLHGTLRNLRHSSGELRQP